MFCAICRVLVSAWAFCPSPSPFSCVLPLSHFSFSSFSFLLRHNWADENGETHFTLCNLTQGWKSAAFGPGQPPIFTNTMTNMSSGETKLTWFFTPPHWKPETYLHANPVVQFGIWFVGRELFVSSDGTQVYMSPGTVYFGLCSL